MRLLDLSNLEVPPVRWIVPGLFGRDHLNLLVGAGGASKSFLALDLALALAGGESFLGTPLAPLSVLYVDEDGPERLLTRRLEALALGRSKRPADYASRLFVSPASGLQIDRPDAFASLVATATASKVGLIVLDALVALHGGDENDSSVMRAFMRGAIRTLMRETGAGVILIHHEGKPSTENPRQGVHRARGSTEIINASDQAIWIAEQDDHRRLSIFRSRLTDKAEWPKPIDYNIVSDGHDGARLERLDAQDSKVDHAVAALRALPTPPRTVNEAVTALAGAYSRATVGRAMTRLRAD